MATTVLVVSVSSDDNANPSDNPPRRWTELIGDAGLNAWTRAPLHANRQFQDKWVHVGSVGVPDQQTKKLVSERGTGVIVNGLGGRSWNIVTKQPHADVEAHIEFMIPKGSNSGVYFMGRYEIQVLDSWGRKLKELKHGDCGGIYQRWDPKRGRGKEGFEGQPPRCNASKPPGQWQSFDVVFRGPRFDEAGNKTANARFVRVVHNGKVVHENVEVTGPTRGAGFHDEQPTGPIMIQGDHDPVAYRNIRVRLLK
ncbi:MAG: DUF1080 domain-containing protein [Planctomycetaceae bacterium]|nr:DUF1080 domain-containing protein [Planctomycetaceae bacterium]